MAKRKQKIKKSNPEEWELKVAKAVTDIMAFFNYYRRLDEWIGYVEKCIPAEYADRTAEVLKKLKARDFSPEVRDEMNKLYNESHSHRFDSSTVARYSDNIGSLLFRLDGASGIRMRQVMAHDEAVWRNFLDKLNENWAVESAEPGYLTITIPLPPIALSYKGLLKVPFHDMKLLMKWSGGELSCYVAAMRTKGRLHHSGTSRHMHPHISDEGSICWGSEYNEAAYTAKSRGDILTIWALFNRLYRTYNPHGPYAMLEEFSNQQGIRCRNYRCNRWIKRADIPTAAVTCPVCCSAYCVKCSKSFRVARSPRCAVCRKEDTGELKGIRICKCCNKNRKKTEYKCCKCGRHLCYKHVLMCMGCGEGRCLKCSVECPVGQDHPCPNCISKKPELAKWNICAYHEHNRPASTSKFLKEKGYTDEDIKKINL
jgi:hypothetical protein